MSFTFNPSAGETESSSAVDLRRRLAAAMLQQGMQTSPIQSPWQGAARLSEALMGGLAVRRQAQQEQDANAQIISAITGQPYTPPAQSGGFLSRLFGNNGVPASGAQGQVASSAPAAQSGASADNSSPAGMADSAGGDMSNYQNAISSIESGGNYGEIGPRSGSMGRALGKYQVMEANVGPWSQEAIGRTVTPQEFLANPQIQDAIFNHKFGQYVKQFGPAGASQAWFAGPGGVGKLDRRDSLGTSVAAYTDKFNRALGAAPTQVASLDPSAGMASAMPAAAAQPIVPPPSPTAQPGNMASVTPDQMQAMLGPAPTPGYQDPTVTTAYREPQPMAPAAQAINQQTAPPAPDQIQTASLGPNAGAQAAPTPQAAIPSPAPVGSQAAASTPDQAAPRAQLAQAMMNGPGTATNPIANNPRAQALMSAMMNPNASPQVRSLAGTMLQQVMRPNEFGFQTLPDGTIMRTDPRTGTVAPVYQATPKPVEVNGRLVDPVSGRVIADYSNPQVSTVDGAVIDNRTGQPIYQSHKPMDVNGHLVDPVTGQQVGDYSNPNVSQVDGALIDQRTGKVLYQGTPKGVTVDPGQSLVNPQTGQVLVQGSGYKPEDVTNLRKEIQQLPSYKSYQQAAPVYQSMVDTAKTDTKASDLNLVYGLGKIMDPNSVVREGEMIMVNNTASLPDWVQGMINSVNGGERLQPATRQAILNEARNRMGSYRGMLDTDLNQYRGIVGRKGMNEADVIPNLNETAAVPQLIAPETRTPAAGTSMPTATGRNGEKIQWNGSEWVPLTGQAVPSNSNVNRVPTGN